MKRIKSTLHAYRKSYGTRDQVVYIIFVFSRARKSRNSKTINNYVQKGKGSQYLTMKKMVVGSHGKSII